jgi:hypothetical protein
MCPTLFTDKLILNAMKIWWVVLKMTHMNGRTCLKNIKRVKCSFNEVHHRLYDWNRMYVDRGVPEANVCRLKSTWGTGFTQTFTYISNDPETFWTSNGSIPTVPIIQQFHSRCIHTLLSVSKRGRLKQFVSICFRKSACFILIHTKSLPGKHSEV